jgi:hypothetical protein
MSRRAALVTTLLALLAAGASAQSPAPPDDLEARLKAAGDKGKSVETGISLADAPYAIEGGEVVEILIKPSEVAAWGWSDRKTSLFVAGGNVVRKITVATWKEERRLWVGEEVGGLAMYKSGLVVTVPGKRQVWMLNEGNLEVEKQINVPSTCRAIAATPHGTMAFAMGGTPPTIIECVDLDAKFARRTYEMLEVMKTESDPAKVRRHPAGRQPSTCELPTVTDDGKFLLTVSGDTVHKFAIREAHLDYTECGARMGKVDRIVVSADSKLIALPSVTPVPVGHPPIEGSGVWVFEVENLQKPVQSIADCRAFAFARQSGKVIGTRAPDRLGVFSFKGKLEKSVPWEGGVAAIRLGVTHPTQGKLLIAAGTKLFWVSFNE